VLLETTLRSIVAPTLVIVAGVATHLADIRAPVAGSDTLIWIRDASLMASAFMLVALGIRHIRRERFGLTTALPLFFGALMLASGAYLHASLLRLFESGVELAAPIDLGTMNQNADAIIADPSTAPERRSSVSRIRARMVFVESGEIMLVVDETGREAPFMPSEDDHEQRSVQNQLRVLMPLGVQHSRRVLYLLGATIVASSLLGLLTPVRTTALR
jgi:hypothetical protein